MAPEPTTQIVLLRLEHETASDALRDSLHPTPIELTDALARLRKRHGVEECMILAADDRTELLAVFESEPDGPEALVSFLGDWWDVDTESLRGCTRRFLDEAAADHLCRACADAEECDVVSSLRDAYEMACSCRCNGPLLNRLLHSAFRVSRETGNLADRNREEIAAIVHREVQSFAEWRRAHQASPLIDELKDFYERLRVSQIEPLRAELTAEEFAHLENATRAMVKRMLKHPIVHLRETAIRKTPEKAVAKGRAVFGLDSRS